MLKVFGQCVAVLLLSQEVLGAVVISSEADPHRHANHHQLRGQSHSYVQQEKLGELYHKALMDDIDRPKGDVLIHLNPTFPCVRGVTPIGLNTTASAKDGHKYGCGLEHISSEPVVYSFGSNGQTDFEEAIINFRPDSKTYTFELNPNTVPKNRTSNFFYNIGLGYGQTDPIFKSLSEIMSILNHTYIDVLKMDVEGAEHPFFKYDMDVLCRVGQFLFELHLDPPSLKTGGISVFDKNSALKLLSDLESKNLRMFYKELHPAWWLSHALSEFSFVQKDWTLWDHVKHNFPPITPGVRQNVCPQ